MNGKFNFEPSEVCCGLTRSWVFFFSPPPFFLKGAVCVWKTDIFFAWFFSGEQERFWGIELGKAQDESCYRLCLFLGTTRLYLPKSQVLTASKAEKLRFTVQQSQGPLLPWRQLCHPLVCKDVKDRLKHSHDLGSSAPLATKPDLGMSNALDGLGRIILHRMQDYFHLLRISLQLWGSFSSFNPPWKV